jgi:LysR family transcriptional regulator, regulator of abg operon
MRLNQLREFVCVVETGSLREAARRLGVSQPAITKNLQRLEAELHAQLLQRSTRGVMPTRAGRAFLARAKVVQTELRKVQEELDSLRGGAEGGVAFGIAPAACMLIVPDAMLEFRRSHPHARVRIVEGVNTALLPLVRDETLDFMIGQKPNARLEAALRFKPLFTPPLVVAARTAHPLSGIRSLRELAAAQWLMFYAPGTGGMLERAFKGAGLAFPRNVIQCESYAVALALLAKTDTLGLVIPQLLEEPYAQKFLRRIAIAETIPAPVVGIYTRAGAPLTPAASALAQAVTATARRLARGA